MSDELNEIKKELDTVISEASIERKNAIQEYEDTVRDAKITKIKNSILSK